MEKNNLNQIRPVIFLANDNETEEIFKNEDMNNLILDPYKKYTVSNLFIHDIMSKQYNIDAISNLLNTANDNTSETIIKNFIYTNIKDVTLSVAMEFIDIFRSSFIYTNDIPYESHYEFDAPFDVMRNVWDDIEFEYIYDNQILSMGDDLVIDYTINKVYIALSKQYASRTYSDIVTKYFEKIFYRMISFYMSKPEMLRLFFQSYVEDSFNSFQTHGMNKAYNYLSTIIREAAEEPLNKLYIALEEIYVTNVALCVGTWSNEFDEFDVNKYLNTNSYILDFLKDGEPEEEKEESDNEISKALVNEYIQMLKEEEED